MPDRPGTSHSCHPASGEGRNELERAGVQAEFGDSSPADASGRTDALAEHSAVGGFEVDETAELAKAIPTCTRKCPRSRPVTLWDNWKVLASLVTLMSLEGREKGTDCCDRYAADYARDG